MRIVLTDELLNYMGELYQNSVSRKVEISFEQFVDMYMRNRRDLFSFPSGRF